MTFLQQKVRDHDLVRVAVTESPGGQILRAVVEEVCSRREFDLRPGTGFTFVSQPGHWGQRVLGAGCRAFVFLRRISGKWYEDAWRGDLPIEEIDGVQYALYQHDFRLLTAAPGIPDELRTGWRPHPDRRETTCFELAATEAHLRALVDREHGPGRPAEPVGRRPSWRHRP
ncbi:hypothetical protein [Kitasatospora sp. KL5]|uniref:hypothetical protein n=1 Tax=Kitasatospora sp. KL5 TaxID=3425125 RepID=UPI003D6F4C82